MPPPQSYPYSSQEAFLDIHIDVYVDIISCIIIIYHFIITIYFSVLLHFYIFKYFIFHYILHFNFECNLLIILLQLSQFFPLWHPSSWYYLPSSNPPLSSCPRVRHVSSLASPFPVLFLTSPCLFCTNQFVLLIPASFPPFSPSPPS